MKRRPFVQAFVQRAHGLQVSASAGPCRRGSAAPARTATPGRPDTGWSPGRRQMRPRPPARGAARTTYRRWPASSRKRSVCQQHLVGHALERLAEHDKSAGLRVARPEVDVGQPPGAAARAPLDGEHTRSSVCTGLTLSHGAAARLVRRVGRLHHHALVPGAKGRRRTVGRLARRWPGGDACRRARSVEAANAPAGGPAGLPSRAADRRRTPKAVDRPGGSTSASARTATRHLKSIGRAAGSKVMASPSRISSRKRSAQRPRRPRAAAGDFVQASCIDAHLGALSVHLHARSVELGLEDGRPAHLSSASAIPVGGLREHGRTGRKSRG